MLCKVREIINIMCWNTSASGINLTYQSLNFTVTIFISVTVKF